MGYIFVGLGNPGEEYSDTRHNTGRMILEWFVKSYGENFKYDKKINSQVSKIKIGKSQVQIVLPDTFMNNSGKAVKPLITSVKSVEKLLVIYDDLDLPFGKMKMSFNKSSGGHRGLESIIKNIKTEKFTRIRVGIAPTSPTGKIRKPQGEDKVMKHILGQFRPEEMMQLKKLSKKIFVALETFVGEGLEKARNEFN